VGHIAIPSYIVNSVNYIYATNMHTAQYASYRRLDEIRNSREDEDGTVACTLEQEMLLCINIHTCARLEDDDHDERRRLGLVYILNT